MSSCPSADPMRSVFDIDGDEVGPLPLEYYFYTVLMIVLVVSTPYIYQRIWTVLFGLLRHNLNGGRPIGCKRIGKPGDRNLSKETAFRRSKLVDKGTKLRAGTSKVEALFIHPIKSCYPIEVESGLIEPTGFQYDRQFCFAHWQEATQTSNGNGAAEPQKGSSAYWSRVPHWEFLTQRQNPSLTHIKVEIWVPDEDSRDYDPESEIAKAGGCLFISFAHSPRPDCISNILALLVAKVKAVNINAKPVWAFQIPLSPTKQQIEAKGYGVDKLRIWREEPSGIDMTREIPEHILAHLNNFLTQDTRRRSPAKFAKLAALPDLRLFRVDGSFNRNVHKCAPTESQLGYQSAVGYQDSYPIHLQNITSIVDMDTRIAGTKDFKPDSRRFRANIYISHPIPYDEDAWILVRIGTQTYHVSCRTTRCKLPTNDPDTGLLGSDNQPYSHLLKERAIDEGAPNSGCLGMMLVPSREAVGSRVRVGDEVEVLKRGEHFFVADVEPEAQRPVI